MEPIKKESIVNSTTLMMKDGKPIQGPGDKKYYYHDIKFQNGDVGIYVSTKDVQNFFIQGKPAKYFMSIETKKDGKTWTKIKPNYEKDFKEPPTKEPTQGAEKDKALPPINSFMDIAIESNKRAIEAWLGNGIAREDIKSFSREMADYLLELIKELNDSES